MLDFDVATQAELDAVDSKATAAAQAAAPVDALDENAFLDLAADGFLCVAGQGSELADANVLHDRDE